MERGHLQFARRRGHSSGFRTPAQPCGTITVRTSIMIENFVAAQPGLMVYHAPSADVFAERAAALARRAAPNSPVGDGAPDNVRPIGLDSARFRFVAGVTGREYRAMGLDRVLLFYEAVSRVALLTLD